MSLTANPATGITKGSPVALTANVTERRPFPLPRLTVLGNLRYTFTAQRTWPCSDAAQVIAQNASNATVNWTPPKAGLYTFRVSVSNFEKLPNPPIKNAPLAEATIGNYRVGPPAGFSHQITFLVSPPSGTLSGPATLSVGINVANPGSHRFSYKFYLGGTCGADFPNTCTISNVPAGSYLPTVEVNEIDPGTCDLVGFINTHDYNYYVVNR
ncbi:MAG TPA: hypothetical protein VJ853_05445 [Thermoanaerobaculia bacterium]|nr:hypothetical protein [Thermoanaerobaculia bacterium]